MRIIDAGTSAIASRGTGHTWGDLRLPAPWHEVIATFEPGSAPRPIQVRALGELRVLETRRNLIIIAPTGSGKTLVGYLVLLDAVRRGGRAVLIEPLRAVAREKADELEALTPRLGTLLGRQISVRIATGDYRLDDEALAAPPPDQGELIIATPERLATILRNPDYDAWVGLIGAVCVDEAHLISAPRRGPTLEHVITTLLCLPAPPRVALLSATIGDTSAAQAWLTPCDLADAPGRCPPLHKSVAALSEGEDASDAVGELVAHALADPAASALIFVYQPRSAERLARLLREQLGSAAGPVGPLAYHAQLSAARREETRHLFRSGKSRCLVATSALGLGVNLPATHVFVRDTTFAGVGPLNVADLLQMMGRAGRDDRAGHAIALVRPTDAWDAAELAEALKREELPPLASHFRTTEGRRYANPDPADAATLVAAALARLPDGTTTEGLSALFQRSLGAGAMTAHIPASLAWLSDPWRLLAYRDDADVYRLTTLGLRAARAMLPLTVAAGYAQLIRDLLTIAPDDRLLGGWRPLDHLVALHLVSERPLALRPFSAQLADQVDTWMEQHPADAPLLYKEWIAGQVGASRAAEVLGSLGVVARGRRGDEQARRDAYVAVFHAALLLERARGGTAADIERRWKVRDLDGIEERWRDDQIWLLSGLARLLDLRCFYYHLREDLAAGDDRVRRVKRQLRRMTAQTLELREALKYCSPLGPLLRSLRRTRASAEGPTVGVQTIRRLEDAGVHSMAEIAPLQVDDLVRLGVRRDLAEQIRSYVRRRLQ